MKLIVLIPALNEAATITKVIQSIPKQYESGVEIQVLVVDDGSTDDTARLAKEAGAVVISHSHNQGVGTAFHTGLNAALKAGADIMVNIDADGQFSYQDIPRLIAPILADEADFVTGDRFADGEGHLHKPENMSPILFWGNSQMAKLISVLIDHDYTDVSCGFRAYSKEAMLRLNLIGKFTYTQETFIDLAFKDLRIKMVPVQVKYFPERKSRVAGSILRYMINTLKIIIRSYRDYKPMRFFGGLGLIPFVPGVLCGLFVGIHYLITSTFTPYKFVGIIGIYLFSLGLLLWIVGLFADMFVRLRSTQEQLMYYEKLSQNVGNQKQP